MSKLLKDIKDRMMVVVSIVLFPIFYSIHQYKVGKWRREHRAKMQQIEANIPWHTRPKGATNLFYHWEHRTYHWQTRESGLPFREGTWIALPFPFEPDEEDE